MGILFYGYIASRYQKLWLLVNYDINNKTIYHLTIQQSRL